MFNLNIPPSSLLSIENSGLCSTPKTPEIVNSLIAMTNPMDNYNFSALCNSTASTPSSAVLVRSFNGAPNGQSISQDSSHSSCSTSPLDSPAGINATPSVQQTCSQLIKAGLKLSIQSKRKLSTCDSSSGSEQPNSKCSRRGDEDCDDSSDEDDSENKSTTKGLTPEDEDRRRRRRERNKIAATKCRMKKRERTQNLIKESEQLDTQNVDLKHQVRTLETERRKLLEMLQAHAPNCVRRGGFSLPSKLQQSPAYKYLAELELDEQMSSHSKSHSIANTTSNVNGTQAQQQQLQTQSAGGCGGGGNQAASMPQQRTAIPPMSTIKFSRSNGFKAAAAATTPTANQQQQQQQLHQQQQQQHQQLPAESPTSSLQQLPNGYCKPSPTPHELGYLNSPSQESICLPSLQSHHHQHSAAQQQQQQQQQQHSPLTSHHHHQNVVSISTVSHQLSDYIPNCDNSLGALAGLVHTPSSTTLNVGGGGDNSALLGGGSLASPQRILNTPTNATNEFVKNELVDSQSPYTTAQSAERFLFESNCDSYVDIKHAVSLHPGSLNHGSNGHNSGLNHNGHNNNNNSSSLLDFHSPLMGVSSGVVSFHEQISIKNDYLHDADLLAQLTSDAGEFVDLDTGVAAAFMTNGGCLA